MLKKCTKCKKWLPKSDYNWKFKNLRLAVHCKMCSRKYIREHYKNNRRYYLEKAQKRNLELKTRNHDYIGRYLLNHPCADCGEKDILVLEFDHKDKHKKYYDISHIIVLAGSLNKLKAEILKCEVRCANCHRRKTAKESKSWKLIWAPVA